MLLDKTNSQMFVNVFLNCQEQAIESLQSEKKKGLQERISQMNLTSSLNSTANKEVQKVSASKPKVARSLAKVELLRSGRVVRQ